MDNMNLVEGATLTVEKKPLVLVLLNLGPISLQIRAILKILLQIASSFLK